MFSSVASCDGYLLLKNAKVYTVSDDVKWAQAILINEDTGLIESVGSDETVTASAPEGTTEIEMEGMLVLPGFQDAHLHAVEAGINENLCLFDEDTPISSYPSYFVKDAEYCPTGGVFGDQGWYAGAGVDIGILQESREEMPQQELPIQVLDRDFPSTPVFILDSLGHGAIVNTAALEAVGYNQDTPDPRGGVLHRDPATGELTGIILENAQQPFRDAAFPPTDTNKQIAYNSLLEAMKTLNANGITSVCDAGGFWRQAQTEAWEQAEEAGKMSVRASNSLYVYPDEAFEDQLPQLKARFSDDPTKLVRFNQAKIYVDGILSLATSALIEPYESSLALAEGQQLGFEYFGDGTTLDFISRSLTEEGFQLHLHVTGDRGARLALDAIAGSNASSGPHRLTHLYLVDASDRGRFSSQNVIADMQSAPSSVSKDYRNFISGIIGTSRANQVVPVAELFDEGATITLSSDWDADDLSPLAKIQTVLTRSDGRNLPDVESVIPMLTKNVAKLLRTNSGVLESGKLADIVVLDKNIFELPVTDIGSTKVLLTLFNGKVFYDPQRLVASDGNKGTITLRKFRKTDPFSLEAGERQLFRVRTKKRLRCEVSASSGNVDIYMTIRNKPTYSSFDLCVSAYPDNDEYCTTGFFGFLPFNIFPFYLFRPRRNVYIGIQADLYGKAENVRIECW